MTKEIIEKVLITEKGTKLGLENRFLLKVAPDATKRQIADAAEKKFGVHVLAVRTTNVKGKVKFIRGTRRTTTTATWKKAFVTVKDGERIEQV